MLDFNEYQEKAHFTADYPEGCVGGFNAVHTNYLYPALGLAAEAGEVADKYAKAIRDYKGAINDERKTAIVKELGDVMWFVAELATCLGVKLEDVAQKNLDKLASRKERGVIHGSGDDR
jgi:NTP pyrophosphatase (non-canonical NTP hydrolase)